MKRIVLPRLFDPDSPIAARSVLFYPERDRMARMSIAVGAACSLIFATAIGVLLVLPGGRFGLFTALGYFALAVMCFAGCAAAVSGVRYLRSERPRYSVELHAQGLAVVEAKRRRDYSWAEFATYTESPAAFTLTLKGTLAQLEVAKEKISATESARLRGVFAQRLPRSGL